MQTQTVKMLVIKPSLNEVNALRTAVDMGLDAVGAAYAGLQDMLRTYRPSYTLTVEQARTLVEALRIGAEVLADPDPKFKWEEQMTKLANELESAVR